MRTRNAIKTAAIGLLLVGLASSASMAQMRITEYEYQGAGVAGEFVEFTNIGATPINMTGWSYDDDSAVPGTTDLSGFGTVAPGESVIMCEALEATFRAAWGLAPGVKIVGSNSSNLGRNDQINLFDAADALVDRLSYGDQTFPGTPRANSRGAWPCSDAVGANNIFRWREATFEDQQDSFFSSDFNVASPGEYTVVVCPPDPTGACCSAGVCTIATEVECASVGLYQGDGTSCGDPCPPPTNADIRITEFMHTGVGGEFIEIRNFDAVSVDLTGWSFSDETRHIGQISLSSLGTLAPGAVAVLTEADAGDFATDWSLSGVPVLGGNTVNIGAADEINIYDSSGALIDRLTYGNVTCSIDTDGRSGFPCSSAVGNNDILEWRRSVPGDAHGSITSLVGDVGRPGAYTSIVCNPGSCCIAGSCSVLGQGDCLSQDGLYFGDGTTCVSDPCPPPNTSQVRITEFMYQGADGEFFEVTNLGDTPVNLTGWTFGDSCVAPGPGAFSIGGIGVLDPGESAIVTDAAPAAFAADWGLSGVTVVQIPSSELGRNDQINIFDANQAKVDRIEYGDEEFPGTPQTVGASAWPLPSGIGTDEIGDWRLSVVPDGQLSYASNGGDVGNPGSFRAPPIPAVSTWGLIVMSLLLLAGGSIRAAGSRFRAARS